MFKSQQMIFLIYFQTFDAERFILLKYFSVIMIYFFRVLISINILILCKPFQCQCQERESCNLTLLRSVISFWQRTHLNMSGFQDESVSYVVTDRKGSQKNEGFNPDDEVEKDSFSHQYHISVSSPVFNYNNQRLQKF